MVHQSKPASPEVRQAAINLLLKRVQFGGRGLAQIKAVKGEKFGDLVLRESRRIADKTTAFGRGERGRRALEEFRVAQALREGISGRLGRTKKQFLKLKEKGKIRGFPKTKLLPGKIIVPIKKRVTTQQTFNILTVPKKPTLTEKTRRRISELRSRIARGKKLTIKENVEMAALTGSRMVLETATGIKQIVTGIGKAGLSIIRDPSNIKKVPTKTLKILREGGKEIKRGAVEFGKTIRVSPTEAIVIIGTEVLIFKGSGKIFRLVGKLSDQATARLSPKFRGVETDPLGRKEIPKVPGVGDIKIIPPKGKGGVPLPGVDPKGFAEGVDLSKVLRRRPWIPKQTSAEKKILAAVKKEGDVVTGSFAQETLLKKQFTTKHKDLDILTSNREKLIKAIKTRLGKEVKFKKRFRSIEVIYKGKVIADLVKMEIGEAGFIRKFGTIKHKGIKFVDPRGRLASKVLQLGKGKRGKVVRDIELLSGKKVSLRGADIRGGFGFSKKEQAKLIGKSGPIATAQIDLLLKGILKPSQLKLKRWLFASPFDLKTKKAQIRTSRLGVDNVEEANLLELLSGDVSFRSGKPQIFIFPKEKIYKAKGQLIKGKVKKTPKGFVVPSFSSELEVVLGKGFAVKRGKKLATTLISGRKVDIIELKKIRIPKKVSKEIHAINNLNKKFKKKISPKNKKLLIKRIDRREKLLNTKLKKLTGFNYYKASRVKKLKTFPLKRKAASLSTSIIKKISSKRRTIESRKLKVTSLRGKGTRPRRGSRPGRGTRGSPGTRAGTGSRAGRVTRGGTGTGPRPGTSPRAAKKGTPGIILFKRKKKIRKTKTKGIGYIIVEKRRGKFVKLKGKPLSYLDSKDRMARRLDHKISRTAKIISVGKVKKLGKIRKQERGYYNKYKRNLREYKIVRGKRIPTPNTFIEKKGRGVISTRGEKEQLRLNRRMKAGRRKTVKKVIIKRKSRSKKTIITIKSRPRSRPRRSNKKVRGFSNRRISNNVKRKFEPVKKKRRSRSRKKKGGKK